MEKNTSQINTVEPILINGVGKTGAQVEQEKETAILNSLPRADDYHYEWVYGAKKEKIIEGYAANQLPGGYRFSSRGAFYYAEEEPGVSISFSLNFGDPYGIIGCSAVLGANSTFGRIIDVNDTQYYWKLYVVKTLHVQPYAIYRYAYPGAPTGTLYQTGATVITFNSDAYPVRA